MSADSRRDGLLLRQIGEYHQYARQHISIVCTGFLTFAGINATFIGISLGYKPAEHDSYLVAHIICAGFFLGDLGAMLAFMGAAQQLNSIYFSIERLLDGLDKELNAQEKGPTTMFGVPIYRFYLRTLLRSLGRTEPVPKNALNAVPVDEFCSMFAGFALACLVAAAVWGFEFVKLALRAN